MKNKLDKMSGKELRDLLLIRKIKTDTPWYMENFLKIRTKGGKLVPFKINSAQKLFHNEIVKAEKEKKLKRFIILKARQMGFSTFTEGLIFKETSTNELVNSLIIAHEDKATQNLFNMSKLYYEELPDEFRPTKKYSNEKALSFENPTNDDVEKKKNPGLRSKITVATAGTAEAGRSSTIHNLHISELAFFPSPETTMTALLQSVPDTLNSMIVIESTANGVGNYFHKMWKQAVRGENNFIPLFYPWFTEPGYKLDFASEGERLNFIDQVDLVTTDVDGREIRTDEYYIKKKHDLTYEQLNWRRYTIANKCNGDLDVFKQEYPSTPEEAFIASGRPKFDIKALQHYETLTRPGIRGYLVGDVDRPKFIKDPKGYLEIWEEPQVGVEYGIGADVAEGLIDGDYSCALVGNQDLEVVAMWHGHIDPDLYGQELVKLGNYYNQAYLGVESNNHGLTTLKTIQDLEYWNIFYQKTYDKISDQLTQKMGWQTNRKSKPLMINKLAEFIREIYLSLPSDLVVQELHTYVINDNGTTDAQQGCHDDTTMALAILLQVLLEGLGVDYSPEVVNDRKVKRISEVIDPLFEREKVEVSK